MTTLWHRVASALRNFTRKNKVERELTEELTSYIDLLTQRKIGEGLTLAEARRAALVEVGGTEQVKEEVRAGRAGNGLETLLLDVRYAGRALRKKPAFTATAVVALALGIGANSAIFSAIDGVLLRSLPYPEPDRVVVVWEHHLRDDERNNSVAAWNFLDWRNQATSFQHFGAVWNLTANLTGAGDPEELKVQFVSHEFFPALAIQPALGRPFAAEEDRVGKNLVVVLSHDLWRTRFGADPGVLGKTATFNGRQRVIVGVMPPDFYFLQKEVQAWMPLALDASEYTRENSGRFLRCVARLKPRVSIEQAQAEMTGIARQLEQAHPMHNTGWGVYVVPVHEQMVGAMRPILIMLLGAVAFVLLIACANVANLLLARATTRQKEFALRAALGAGRKRLIRQVLVESVLLALLGGLCGVLLAYLGVQLLLAFAPQNLPRLDEITIEPRVLAFTLGTSILTGVLFGVVPALQASRPDLIESLKEGGRGSTGGRAGVLRNSFVIAQMALALVLLIGAGLMIRSFMQLQAVELGFDSENVLTLRTQLPGRKYTEPHQIVDFFKRAEEQIAALPGVKAVGAISFVPLTGPASATGLRIVGQPEPAPGMEHVTEVRVVTPTYFRAMGIPLRNGRLLDQRDGRDSRVLLINETLAREHFPNQDPIGKKLIIDWGSKEPEEIVGVVGDIRESALEEEAEPAIYWPHAREPYPFMHLIVRTTGNALQLASAIEKEIRVIDPEQPVADMRTLEQVIDRSIARQRFTTLLLAVFAAVALLLASVGLYGVMNYSATQRTQEIGIRMALGASRADVVRLVVGNGMLLAFIGIVLGVAGSWGLTRLMRTFLFGVGTTDVTTFVVVATLLAIVALIANYIPARRATQVNPVIALRYE